MHMSEPKKIYIQNKDKNVDLAKYFTHKRGLAFRIFAILFKTTVFFNSKQFENIN